MAFDTQQDFAQLIINNTSPILLIHEGRYIDIITVHIKHIFPLIFSLGIDNFTYKQPNQVSKIEVRKHYLKVTLPQFRRQFHLGHYRYVLTRTYVSAHNNVLHDVIKLDIM